MAPCQHAQNELVESPGAHIWPPPPGPGEAGITCRRTLSEAAPPCSTALAPTRPSRCAGATVLRNSNASRYVFSGKDGHSPDSGSQPDGGWRRGDLPAHLETFVHVPFLPGTDWKAALLSDVTHCADRRSLSGSQSTCYVSPTSGARPASGRRMQKTMGTHLPTAPLCLVSALPAPVRPGEEIRAQQLSPPGHPRIPQRGPLPSAVRECPCEDGPSGGRGASAFLPRLDERCPQDEGDANCVGPPTGAPRGARSPIVAWAVFIRTVALQMVIHPPGAQLSA